MVMLNNDTKVVRDNEVTFGINSVVDTVSIITGVSVAFGVVSVFFGI